MMSDPKEFGRILMIPCPISEGKMESIPPESLFYLHKTQIFIVERAKTARRFIKASGHPLAINELDINEIEVFQQNPQYYLELIRKGFDIGVLSEAGCPGIADPGSEIVHWAHMNDVPVVPLVGPSSIFLALMASGLNGQNFCFHGYLSNKKEVLIHQLKKLETQIMQKDQSQIFIETPYRNDFIFETILQTMVKNVKLCIALDINSKEEFVKTKTIQQWQNAAKPEMHKKPCIFILGK